MKERNLIMWSTVPRRIVIIASITLPLLYPGTGSASTPTSQAGVVAKLYRAYAWQAIATQPDLLGEGLAGESRTRLERYFTPELAQLLVKDSACQRKRREICNLDFDPLFNTQDPRVTDLTVETTGPSTVRTQFIDPVTNEKTRITFRLTMVKRQWRIADVIYLGDPQVSLKTVLSRPLANH